MHRILSIQQVKYLVRVSISLKITVLISSSKTEILMTNIFRDFQKDHYFKIIGHSFLSNCTYYPGGDEIPVFGEITTKILSYRTRRCAQAST